MTTEWEGVESWNPLEARKPNACKSKTSIDSVTLGTDCPTAKVDLSFSKEQQKMFKKSKLFFKDVDGFKGLASGFKAGRISKEAFSAIFNQLEQWETVIGTHGFDQRTLHFKPPPGYSPLATSVVTALAKGGHI